MQIQQLELSGYNHYWGHIQLVREVIAGVPTNDLGLPQGIYRFDLLDLNELHQIKLARDAQRTIQPNNNQKNLPDLTQDAGYHVHPPSSDATPTDIDVDLNEDDSESTAISRAQRPILGPLVDNNSNSKSPSIQYERCLQDSFAALHYTEGWPVNEDGRPFWHRIDYEPADAHDIFQIWLHAPSESGRPRALHELQNALLAKGIDVNMSLLQVWFCIFYWGPRARSYDLFAAAQARKQMEIRSMHLMDSHWLQANRLMDRLSQYLEGEKSEEFWELMTPKNAIDLHKHLVQVQRLAAGLPATAPPPRTEHPGYGGAAGQSMELVLRTIAKGASEGNTVSQDDAILTQALGDEDTARVAQELIIRLGSQRS